MPSAERVRDRLLVALAALGAGLQLRELSRGSSLTVDELAVALNVRARSPWALLSRRLAYHQVAPRGFLLAEKAFSSLGGDLSLRLFPQAAALGAIALFCLAARRFLRPAPAVAATALFVFSPALIQYGSFVKQYSGDVFCATALLLLGLALQETELAPSEWLGALAAGAVLAWFSQPALLVEAAIVATLAVRLRGRSREALARTLALAAVWGANGLAVAWLSLRSISAASKAYLAVFWAGGFMSRDWSAPLWFFQRLAGVFELSGLTGPWRFAAVGLAALGVACALRRRAEVGWLLLAPVAVAAAAGAARQYPFGDRTSLFLLPMLLLAAAEGLAAAQAALRLDRVELGWLLLALPLAPVVANALTPGAGEETKPVLARLERERSPGDAVYVYYAASKAALYYGPELGLADADYVQGGCHRGDSRAYLRELDGLRGRRRVWLVFAHALPFLKEREAILGYLDAIGRRVEHFSPEPPDDGTSLYLYDLGDPRRLASAGAATWPLPDGAISKAGFACVGPQAPDPRPGP